MKYPQSWIDAAEKTMILSRIVEEEVLNVHPHWIRISEPGFYQLTVDLSALHKVGALREIPKPREWWIVEMDCEVARGFTSAEYAQSYCRNTEKYVSAPIKVREVLDE